MIPAEHLPPVLTRTYHGKPSDVELLREADAEALAGRGYYPTSQHYLPGTWSKSAWLVAFVLLIFIVGIIVLFYMVANKPAGDLTVIYERRRTSSAEVGGLNRASMATLLAPHSDPGARLQTLDRLRTEGVITEEEHRAKRAAILDEI